MTSESMQGPIPVGAERNTSFAEMLAVYHVCVTIGRCSEDLLNYLIDMELVALNVEIAAAHAQRNQGAFSVLSTEAGHVAKRMSGAIARITSRADELSLSSLKGIIQARLYQKLLQVDAGNGASFTPASLEAIEQGLRESEARLRQTARHVEDVVTDIQAMLFQVEKENKRFETIATYFSIEASRDDDSQAYFTNIAQMLRAICEQTRASIQRMGAERALANLTSLSRRETFTRHAA